MDLNENQISVVDEQKRPVDELAEDTYSWWGKNMVLTLKRKFRSWKFLFGLAFLAGVIIAVIWMVAV